MIFSSNLFIYVFLPVTLLVYLLAEKSGNMRIKNAVVLIASLLFYAWGGVKYLILLLALVLVNYFIGLRLENKKYAKVFLVLGLTVNISVLVFYKYLGFILQNVEALITGIVAKDVSFSIPAIVLPIGISFFIFQIITYLIDVYRGNAPVQKNVFKLALYIMMFPKLTAGPIVRYCSIYKALDKRTTALPMMEEGIKRFIIGLAKKLFIANGVGAIVDVVFALNGEFSTLYAWLGAVCYSLQIFFDVSAYADMAIGLGSLFGFQFLENFNYPYIATSIQDFWRRWHISLSEWFRDYVYIPLGGNRKGLPRTFINLAIVFLLTGIWHGAAWQFIIWGMYHGFFMLIERAGFGKLLNRLPKFVQRIYTLLVVIVGWVFFRADNLDHALNYIGNMFSTHYAGYAVFNVSQALTPMFWTMLGLGILFSIPISKCLKNNKLVGDGVKRAAYLVLFALALIYLAGLSYNPFIYFQF